MGNKRALKTETNRILKGDGMINKINVNKKTRASRKERQLS